MSCITAIGVVPLFAGSVNMCGACHKTQQHMLPAMRGPTEGGTGGIGGTHGQGSAKTPKNLEGDSRNQRSHSNIT